MARLTIRPKARRELQQILGYLIENAGVEVARRFRQAAVRTFEEPAERPLIGAPRKVRRPQFAGIRMWRVKEFDSYLIFYFPRKRGISIERVIHAKQDYQRVLSSNIP
jgi:plasmid stabilization system protein ParE